MICQNSFHFFCLVENKYPFNKRELMGLKTHLLINAFKHWGSRINISKNLASKMTLNFRRLF
jgi:hypothetical protein